MRVLLSFLITRNSCHKVNVGLDLDENSLKTYESFTKEGYNLLREEMSREKQNQGENAYTEDCLAEVDKKLHHSHLPLYRYV